MFSSKIGLSLSVASICLLALSCQSSGPKNINQKKPVELFAQSVKGAESEYFYKSESNVTIQEKSKVTKKYVDSVEFEYDRKTINVNDKGEIQFQISTKNKKGNIELQDLAFLEPGLSLLEMIDKYGKPLVVKDIPMGSIFYIPRITLPKTAVKVGESWTYRGRWISFETGFPFELQLVSTLKAWSDCDGLLCAVITFSGEVILPEDFPLKATLKSKIKGEFYYSHVSYEVLWGVSESVEEFYIEPIDKLIAVKSSSCSHKKDFYKKCK